MRISVCGGGTDFFNYYKYNDFGCVISTTINKYVYVIIKERFDNKIGCYYHNSEIVNNINEIRHDLIRETAIFSGLKNGFDVSILSDAPHEGVGLGTSSSMTVGLLNAFYTYLGNSISTQQLAEYACKIEIDILKKPIGKQDQFQCAYGNVNFIRFNSDGSVEVKKINLKSNEIRQLEENLLLYFTNVSRKAGFILTEQRENINKNVKILNDLRELTLNLYDDLEMNKNIDNIGKTLDKNWYIKKQFASTITNNEIDKLYKLAIENGASGGKISGAGGGGFCILYCRKELQDQLRKSLNGYFEFPFRIEERGSRIIFNIPIQTIK